MKTILREKIVWHAPAVFSGVLVALSFPSYNLFPLAWAGFVPLLYILWSRTGREAFKAGYVFGVTFFFSTIYWIYHSVHFFGGLPFIASLAVVFLLCLYLALYPALFAFLFSAVIKKTKLPALLIAPLIWVVLEFARSYALTGFPWASIGYSQYSFLPMIQIADITGIYGVSFLVLMVNGAIFDMLLMKQKIREMPLYPAGSVYIWMTVAGFVLCISLGYGAWRLGQERATSSFRVSVVQGNIAQDKKWEPLFQKEVLDIYYALSQKTAGEFAPQLIVWPETAVPFLYDYDLQRTGRLLEMQKTLNAYLLFGSVMMRDKTETGSLLTNSAILLEPGGRPVYKYDKIHLVPFGEYVPLRSLLFFVDRMAAGIGDYVAGESYLKGGTGFGSFGTLICYEIIFPGLVRKFFTRGGDFMVTITNDAWFGRTAGPHQHFTMAVFRAIENRKPVIRAANTGISGIIDSNGRITQASKLFERTVVSGAVPMDPTMTLYTRYGDIFSYLCMVGFLVIVLNIKIWR